LAYELRFSSTAARQLRKLDRTEASHIVDYLEAVSALDDLTVRGKNLTGDYSGILECRRDRKCKLETRATE